MRCDGAHPSRPRHPDVLQIGRRCGGDNKRAGLLADNGELDIGADDAIRLREWRAGALGGDEVGAVLVGVESLDRTQDGRAQVVLDLFRRARRVVEVVVDEDAGRADYEGQEAEEQSVARRVRPDRRGGYARGREGVPESPLEQWIARQLDEQETAGRTMTRHPKV